MTLSASQIANQYRRCGMTPPRATFIISEVESLRDLVIHCWVHSGYPDCGYREMTTEQKELYCRIIDSPKAEHDAALMR